jgi:hypothetical protein
MDGIQLKEMLLPGQVDEKIMGGYSLAAAPVVFSVSAFCRSGALARHRRLYGVPAFLFTQRRREISIRMPLGAGAGTVLGMVREYGACGSH